ncbi:jerky protein homolog-like [Colletes gigas]|uniref:jerky protein homolog-like n=1 Tax=Colletes gigas TaxID=935657 RepID=UPI001C9B5757|nr:jerky protein homolog-like [Colletes gigas]
MENSIINKKTVLSIQQKLDIVKKLDAGVPISEIVGDYSVHPSTVRRIRRNCLALHRLGSLGAHVRRRKRLRKPRNEELENRLHTWFLQRKALGDPITDLLLQKQAQEMARQFKGSTEFKASMGWLAKFKNRHNIRLINIFGDKGSTDVAAAEDFAASFTHKLKEENIRYENVYKIDETGLTWKAIPMKQKQLKKDRVSFCLCSNATGTHKLTPLFIYKYKNPRALKNMRNQLPVVFKTQKRAWVDRTVFRDWYENYFKPAVRKQQLESGRIGKVFLLVNNCQDHKFNQSEYEEDNCFRIVCFPSKTTSVLQPKNQGIIAKIKSSFRQKMLQRILSYPGGIQEFYQKYNIKDCINFLHEAWTELTTTDIVNAWRRIIQTMPRVAPTTEEAIDPLEPQFEDMINAIIGEEPSQERVSVFLSTCDEAENNFSEAENNFYEDETDEAEEEDSGRHLWQEQENNNFSKPLDERCLEKEEEEEEYPLEDTRKKELEEAFHILTKHAEHESRFIQLTVANLQEHFLRRKK